MSLKKEIISLLENMSELMELDGENKFKISAFKNGANSLRQINNLEELIERNELKNVKGIGKGILSVINEYIDEGEANDYVELKSKIPNVMIEMLQIRGMGARKIKQIYDVYAPNNLNDLIKLCQDKLIQKLKGFSEKSELSILEEIRRIKESSSKILLNRGFIIAEQVKKLLYNSKTVLQIEISGELRRVREVIEQIELICLVNDYNLFEEEATNLLLNSDLVLLNKNENKLILLYSQKIRVVIHYFLNKSDFVKTNFVLTSANSSLSDLSLNNNYENEIEIFAENKMNFIIPEMREHEVFEHFGKDKIINSDLSIEKFNGFFHFHTTWSDGNNTLTEMVEEANKIGFNYFALCDHSKSAYYANGLKEDRILLQHKEIDKLNKNSDLRIYKGIESDILKDGSLDYDNDILSLFEFVVASIHSNFHLDEDEMAARIIKAVENEHTDLLAHPTGRLLLRRDGYKLNIKKVIDACSQNDVAIEINANPNRLDLDWRNLFYAREKGCKFAINPDAHSLEGIHDIKYGIMIARKGGVQNSEVINCYSEGDFQKFINRKIKRI